jgi:alpha-ketoglutarate-dependent taurine dioxygenase
MMRNSRIEVRPIAGAIGAEIHNVDVGADLDEGTVGDIRQALLDHCVIFFRNQKLDVARHKAFTRRFGEIFIHPNYKGTQADPEIIVITREPGDKKIVGEDWHADTTMMPEPPMGAILYAIEVPPYGGDTLFANQYLAYEALSEGMKKMLSGMRAVCISIIADRSSASSTAFCSGHLHIQTLSGSCFRKRRMSAFCFRKLAGSVKRREINFFLNFGRDLSCFVGIERQPKLEENIL